MILLLLYFKPSLHKLCLAEVQFLLLSLPQQSCQQCSANQLDEALSSSPPPSTPQPSLSPELLVPLPSCSSAPCLMAVSRVNTCISVNKKCMVIGCSELVSPTMWHSHMSLHAGGIFPGEVPRSWLNDQPFAPSVTSWYLTQEHLLIDNSAEVELTQWDQQQSLPISRPSHPIRVSHLSRKFSSFAAPPYPLSQQNPGLLLHGFCQEPLDGLCPKILRKLG